MDDLSRKLDEEINRELVDMYLQDPDAEGYSAATERLAKLYKLRLEEREADSEIEIKSQQLKEAKTDRWFKVAIDSAGIVLPMVFYAVWMKRGFKFEETGTFTSGTFRQLFSRFRPTK